MHLLSNFLFLKNKFFQPFYVFPFDRVLIGGAAVGRASDLRRGATSLFFWAVGSSHTLRGEPIPCFLHRWLLAHASRGANPLFFWTVGSSPTPHGEPIPCFFVPLAPRLRVTGSHHPCFLGRWLLAHVPREATPLFFRPLAPRQPEHK